MNIHERALRLIQITFETEVQASDAHWLQDHLRECAHCRERYEAYAASERALFPLASAEDRLSPADLDRMESRLGFTPTPTSMPRAWSRGAGVFVTAASALALGLFAVGPLGPSTSEHRQDGLQTRGAEAPELQAERLRPLRVRLTEDGAPELAELRAGDHVAPEGRLVFLTNVSSRAHTVEVSARCGSETKTLVSEPAVAGADQRLGPSVRLPEGWGPCPLELSARFLDAEGRLVGRWQRELQLGRRAE